MTKGNAAPGKPERGQRTRDVEVLHLHAQAIWHGRAVVVGNRPGLLALRSAIDRALLAGSSEAEVMASDGEGYRVAVTLRDAAFGDEAWEAARLPYGDPIAADDGDLAP